MYNMIKSILSYPHKNIYNSNNIIYEKVPKKKK